MATHHDAILLAHPEELRTVHEVRLAVPVVPILAPRLPRTLRASVKPSPVPVGALAERIISDRRCSCRVVWVSLVVDARERHEDQEQGEDADEDDDVDAADFVGVMRAASAAHRAPLPRVARGVNARQGRGTNGTTR